MQKHSEHELQKARVEWFRYFHRSRIIFACPNGGKRNEREAVRLKAEGVLAGVADLIVLSDHDSDAKALFVEMKVGKNKQTDLQKQFEYEVVERGYNYAVCTSLDEFMNVVNDFFR